MDEREAPAHLARLVGLQVADQVPLGLRQCLQLGQSLLDSVFAERAQPGGQRGPAVLQGTALGHRHYRDSPRIAAGLGDARAHRQQAALYLSATRQ